MTNQNKSSMLFLTELLVILLIFSFCGAIAVSIFTKGYKKSESASLNTYISIESENIIQCLKYSDGDTDILYEYYLPYEENGTFKLYFDENMNSCKKEDSSYYVEINSNLEDNISVFSIDFFDKDSLDNIYSVKTGIAKEVWKMGNKKNILPSIPTGTTSLIAIFIIICISIFSVLSFVHANNDYNLSVKTQDFIKSYNKADMITENIVCEMKLTNGETTEKLKNLVDESKGTITFENNTYLLTVPINDTMDLNTTLEFNSNGSLVEKSRVSHSKASESEGSQYLELFDVYGDYE